MVQLVDCLPSRHEALDLISGPCELDVVGAREMVLWLRVCTTLIEDLSSVLSTCQVTHNHL